MKSLIIIFLVISSLLFAGCGSDKVKSRRYVGEFIDSTAMPESFLGPKESKIKTTMGVFIIPGHISALKGAKVYLYTYERWGKKLCIQSIMNPKEFICQLCLGTI